MIIYPSFTRLGGSGFPRGAYGSFAGKQEASAQEEVNTKPAGGGHGGVIAQRRPKKLTQAEDAELARLIRYAVKKADQEVSDQLEATAEYVRKAPQLDRNKVTELVVVEVTKRRQRAAQAVLKVIKGIAA